MYDRFMPEKFSLLVPFPFWKMWLNRYMFYLNRSTQLHFMEGGIHQHDALVIFIFFNVIFCRDTKEWECTKPTSMREFMFCCISHYKQLHFSPNCGATDLTLASYNTLLEDTPTTDGWALIPVLHTLLALWPCRQIATTDCSVITVSLLVWGEICCFCNNVQGDGL